jgi:tRNA dimethylallyltransferase
MTSIIPQLLKLQQTTKKPLLAVVGPTASGKTKAAVAIAQKLNGEVVNADSLQVYRHLDIITANVTAEEMQGMPHYLFKIIRPDEKLNVVKWRALALAKCQEILTRQKLPILCGGTGLFVNALTKNFQIPSAKTDPNFRSQLEKKSSTALFRELQKFNPQTKLHPNNRKAVIRALEIAQFAGKEKLINPQKSPSEFQSLIIGISVNRQKLYERINTRVEAMLEEGLIAEVENVLKLGYPKNSPALLAHGALEVIAYLEGRLSKAEMISKMQQNTRNYAKRQLTWWRRDQRVIWINPKTLKTTEKIEF